MNTNNALVFAQQQRIAQLEEKLAEPPCCRVSFIYGWTHGWKEWKHYYTSEKEFQQLRAALTFCEFGRFVTLTEMEVDEVWMDDIYVDADEDRKIRKLLGSWKAGALFARKKSACNRMLEILCLIYTKTAFREYKPMFDRICILHPVRENDSPVYKDSLNIIIYYAWH